MAKMLEVDDNVEAVGFRALGESIDAFLVIHEDAASSEPRSH